MALLGLDLGRILATSLPNVGTIFVGIALFCSLYPLRERPAWRIACAVAACLLCTLGSAAVAQLLNPQLAARFGEDVPDVMTSAYFTLVLVFCLRLSHWVFELRLWDAIFCTTAGYMLQNIAHSAFDVVNLLLIPATWPAAASTACHLAIAAAVFAIAYHTFIKQINVQHLRGGGDARTLFVLAGVIAVNIVLSTSVTTIRDVAEVGWGTYLALRLAQLMVSMLLLYLDYEILYSNRLRESEAATRQLAEDQRRQYELSAETVEAINVRCHDIRHQVRKFSRSQEVTGKEFLDNLSDLISVYDASVQTGNQALDVILSEKSLLCHTKNIELTCVVDGTALGFMAEQDVYSLFGNALDNAIEATDRVSDPERRLIDVSTRVMGQMVSVQVRNYYEGAAPVAAPTGGLRTSKTDGGLHGYGTKSMRLIAERYGGDVSFDAQNGLFRLAVLLPMETSE